MKKTNCKAEVTEAQKKINFDTNAYQIRFETSHGSITLDLYPQLAPNHCRNIIGLTDIGFYDGLVFHRVVKNFVIQGGCPVGNGTGSPGYSVAAEFNNEKHVPGTLSMARAQDPNSAGSQFFLCTANVPYLDGQYTVFGKTADQDSLGVVLKIGQVSTGRGDRPNEDVVITRAQVLTNLK